MSDRETFSWRDTFAIVDAAWRSATLTFDATRHAFMATDAAGLRTVHLPRLLPVRQIDPDPARFLSALEGQAHLGRCALVLVHAGASALLLHHDDELIAHKVIKKYVVRGTGKAQPKHLKTRGKSRYGSRLRLQNYASQLHDTLEKLGDWRREFGAFDRVHLACGARLEHDLLSSPPGLPWPSDFPLERVPVHVHVPDFAEAKRVRWLLTHGRIERIERIERDVPH